MKFNLENLPECEKCVVFTSDETRTSTARAIYCEGLRAVGSCPKDEWSEGCKNELRQKILDLGDTTIHSMHDNVKGKIAAQNKKEAFEEILGKLTK